MYMKILITGACGFLGRNLVRQLFDYELVLMDQHPNLFDEAVRESWFYDYPIFHADINENIDVIKRKLKGVDIVIHLANKTRIQPSWTEYEQYYRTNITGSQKLFAACQDANVKKFIYVSSSSVYGNNNTLRQHETDKLCPTNPYAVSKLAGEAALTVQAQGQDTELIIVRPFTMYGDFMDFGEEALVIAKFLKAWEEGEPLFIHGNGEQRRDFIHALDAIQGLKLIIEHGRHGDIFNIGTGESVSIKQLADVVSQKQILVPDRKGPVIRTEADISRLKKLGFKPRVKVLEWLTDQVNEHTIKEIIT